jgi:PmbA protein
MAPKKKKSQATRSRRSSPAHSETYPTSARYSASDLEHIAERVLKFSEADETEVEVDSTVDALTRFANNSIHQNVSEHTLGISVRAVVDGRTARATTNKTDEESLRRVVAAAMSLARNQPENPDLLPMLGPQKYQKVSHYFASTVSATPQDRARAVTRVCKMAEEGKQTAAGIFTTGYVRNLLVNSKGLSARHDRTRAEFSVTILEENSSGWAKANSPDILYIDPDALFESASEKAAGSRKPQELEPGHYTAILEPAAVLDFVGFIFYDFAGTAVLDKRSCFNDRMGKKIFGENVTLWDDVYHPLQVGAPWDGEGFPRQKVLLVDRGVPKNQVYARATAKKKESQADRPRLHSAQ